MPKSHKDFLKRTIAQAVLNLQRAARHLADVHDEFVDVHPVEAEYLRQLAISSIMIVDLIDAWWSEVWGPRGSDWESYRNPTKKKKPLPDEVEELKTNE